MKIRIRWLILSVVGAGLLLGTTWACADEEPGLRLTPTPSANHETPIPSEPTLPSMSSSPTQTRPHPSQTSLPSSQATLALTFTPEALVTDHSSSPIGTSNPIPQDPYIIGLVEAARLDLASRLKIPVDQVQFVSFEAVVWPDGSLGCPQPEMLYIQVQQEGYRITLSVQDERYPYHGSAKRGPFLCEIK